MKYDISQQQCLIVELVYIIQLTVILVQWSMPQKIVWQEHLFMKTHEAMCRQALFSCSIKKIQLFQFLHNYAVGGVHTKAGMLGADTSFNSMLSVMLSVMLSCHTVLQIASTWKQKASFEESCELAILNYSNASILVNSFLNASRVTYEININLGLCACYCIIIIIKYQDRTLMTIKRVTIKHYHSKKIYYY